jgi:hypothetical protein
LKSQRPIETLSFDRISGKKKSQGGVGIGEPTPLFALGSADMANFSFAFTPKNQIFRSRLKSRKAHKTGTVISQEKLFGSRDPVKPYWV